MGLTGPVGRGCHADGRVELLEEPDVDGLPALQLRRGGPPRPTGFFGAAEPPSWRSRDAMIKW